MKKSFKTPEPIQIKIDGSIRLSRADDTHDQFLDELTEWLDNNGYAFTGYTEQIGEEPRKPGRPRKNDL